MNIYIIVIILKNNVININLNCEWVLSWGLWHVKYFRYFWTRGWTSWASPASPASPASSSSSCPEVGISPGGATGCVRSKRRGRAVRMCWPRGVSVRQTDAIQRPELAEFLRLRGRPPSAPDEVFRFSTPLKIPKLSQSSRQLPLVFCY